MPGDCEHCWDTEIALSNYGRSEANINVWIVEARPISQTVAPTRSVLEASFCDLVHRASLQCPQLNVLLRGERYTHEVDAYWPEHRLVVELDGFAFHRTRRDHERDDYGRDEHAGQDEQPEADGGTGDHAQRDAGAAVEQDERDPDVEQELGADTT